MSLSFSKILLIAYLIGRIVPNLNPIPFWWVLPFFIFDILIYIIVIFLSTVAGILGK